MSDNNSVTVELNGKQVTVENTGDGPEVTNVKHPENTAEKFADDTGFERGSDLRIGSVQKVIQHSGSYDVDDGVSVFVDGPEYDVMDQLLSSALEAGWIPVLIEFESGYIVFYDIDAGYDAEKNLPDLDSVAEWASDAQADGIEGLFE